jgi:hypothetical protein
MIKIIDLDIEGSLTGDTRVEEIALVQMPAIEQNFIYFTQQDFVDSITDYPQYITDTAIRAKNWVDENGYGSCMTPVGKQRLNQLANREPLSLLTLKRMKAFGSRHKTDWEASKSFEDGCGYLALASWGFEPSTYDNVMNYLDRVITREEMATVGPRGGINPSKKAPKSTTPNKDPKGEGSAKGDASSTRGAEVSKAVEEILQNKSDDFNEKYKDKLGYGVNLGMLKSVYQRGVGAYNTSHSPAVKSSQQWALARVNAFLYLVKSGRSENPKYTTDYDLLPTKHPKKNKGKEDMDIDVSNLPPYNSYPTGDTKNDMLIKPVLFVERNPGEDRSDYINRCTEYLITNEGKSPEQAYAICNSEADEYSIGQNVSFDYDDTLNTPRGRGLALHELQSGSNVYIISARGNKETMYPIADELGIPHSKVFATGSNRLKIQKIKELRIDKHYDNNEDVIDSLGTIGIQFMCPCLDEFVKTKEQGFTMIGFIDGEPVFTTPEEAELYGETEHGCSGHHKHQDEDGNTVYMGCEMHPEKMEQDFGVDEYSPEEIEVVKNLYFLKENDYEKFEAVIGSMAGATETEVKRRNHRTPTTYFQYQRVLSGSPDRDFCMSIEGRYFRRLEIDLLRDTNTEFGHERQPYSKWLYKGGPNCVHAWHKYLVQGNVISDQGMAPGTPGIPPKQLPNNGYYSPETKRKSEVAYIISQQGMSKMGFKSDDEKRMVYSPLMIPNILIPRLDDNNEKYFVRFTPQVIEKIQNLYMIEKRLDKTNYEHTENKMESVVMVESWIVSGESDKAYELGFSKDNVPMGTWMAGFKVLDTEEGDYIWNEFIKKGKVKGFSVEGNFIMNFSAQNNDEYLLQEIINIIKQIND